MFTRAATSNLEWVGAHLDRGTVDELVVKVLAEAQTSGGLLISVPQPHLDELVTGLKVRGTWSSAVVGEVAARTEHSVILK
jgi:selenide,water dikinase